MKNAQGLIARLSRGSGAIRALVEGVDDDEARWHPPSGGWSILEVVYHLKEEETGDFRQRLRLTLEDPASDWPKLDPEAVVRNGRSEEKRLAAELDGFLAERAKSIAWLSGLESPDWSRTHAHPRGAISAGDLLASWVAHDLLHVRQIARLRYEYVRVLAGPYRLDYAGAAPQPPSL
ncbi:MAG TPA: DinB family protein [Planctomycetota bacterium]|nr:DinB family protein [Planctomycetota bacterium]